MKKISYKLQVIHFLMGNTFVVQPQGRRPFTFDRVVRIIISVVFIAGGIWLLQKLSQVLLPFLVAWLIAYILEPFVQRNRKVLHTKGRILAIMLTLFEVLLLLVVLCVSFMPSIVEEMHQVAVLIRAYATSNYEVRFIPPQVHDFLLRHLDFIEISDILTRQNIESLYYMIGSFITGGVNFVLSAFNWFLVVLYVIFIMLDYERLLRGFKHMVPPRYRTMVFAISDDVKDSMNHYFRGQALIAFCVGVLFSIGFLIVGLPLAIVLGMFIGLLNMVPYLQLVSLPITTILCLVYSVQDRVAFWPLWWECMAVYVVVQCIQDLILTPRIMGKAMGMNPAIILLSLSIWGSLLGIIGMIIALPLTTLLISYYTDYLTYRDEGESQSEIDSDKEAFKDMIE